MPLLSNGAAMAWLAERDPDRPAVVHEGKTASRRELDRRANRLARAYAARGVAPGDLVTLGLPNGVEFLAATLAAWKLGATPQPVSARLPARERAAIVDLADPSLVVGVDPADAGGRPAVPAGFEPGADVSDAPFPT